MGLTPSHPSYPHLIQQQYQIQQQQQQNFQQHQLKQHLQQNQQNDVKKESIIPLAVNQHVQMLKPASSTTSSSSILKSSELIYFSPFW